MTFFDTAEAYGPFINEEVVGEALAPVPRPGRRSPPSSASQDARPRGPACDSRPEHIRAVAEASLKRLEDGSHRPVLSAPRRSGRADRGRRRRGQGPDRAPARCGISVSRRPARTTIRRAHAVQPVTALQSEYSLWWREPEAEILPTLEELGIGFVPFSPLGEGFLTGAISAEDDLRRLRFPQQRCRASPRKTGRPTLTLVQNAIGQIAEPQGRDTGPGRAGLAAGPEDPGSCRSPAPRSFIVSTKIWVARRWCSNLPISRRSRLRWPRSRFTGSAIRRTLAA